MTLTRLAGVGPALARTLGEQGISTVSDLVWLLPIGYDQLGSPSAVSEAVRRASERPRLVIRARVRSSSYAFVRRRRAVRVELEDATGAPGRITAWWFFASRGIVERARPGAELLFVGRISPKKKGEGATLVHPLIAELSETRNKPIYPRVGIGPDRLAGLVRAALEATPDPPAPVPQRIAAREGFSAVDFSRVHGGSDDASLERAREQLAWGAAFARSFERVEAEARAAHRPAAILPKNPQAIEALRRSLGFAFTRAQRTAIEAIAADLAEAKAMRRLLQGDVGSGKTAVALSAVAQTVAAGRQALVFAPTTPLADQYAAALAPLERDLGWKTALVTGSTTAVERNEIHRRSRARELDVVIATHAILTAEVDLPELALAVVDEQQRLGVAQRLGALDLGDRNRSLHLLTLSATPIPRSLALALRGELSQSELDELPPGRIPTVTELVPRSSFEARVIPEIRAAMLRGEGTFVVCPRIGDDDSEDESEGPTVIERAAALALTLGKVSVAWVHGRLASSELRARLEAFRAGKTPVLVGTTVVEVGLDVPHATLMVIDGAELFGLAEMHQLRGRVGRSTRPSRCLIVHAEPLAETARQRIDAIAKTTSGSEVARLDLELRGAGDLDGTRQAGETELDLVERFASAPWLERIPADVAEIRARDPKLAEPEHAALRRFVERARHRLGRREEAG